jgi:hypothetical protein
MLNRYYSFAAAAGAAAMTFPGVAEACRCIEPKTPAEAFTRADAVVLAEVAAVTGNIDAEGGAIATLIPSMAWKSDVPATMKVEARTTCAFDFHQGQTYLVYLSKSGIHAPYSATSCDGSQPEAKSRPALDWLRENEKAATISQSASGQ